MTRNLMRNLASFCVATGLALGATAGEENWVNLYDAVTAAGSTLSLDSSAIYGNGAGDSGPRDALFDGRTYSKGKVDGVSTRVLMVKEASENPWVTVTLPAAFATGKRVILRRVDLYPVTYYNNAKNRMPTEYKVYGFDPSGMAIELVHAAGLEYPNLGENAKSNEFYSVAVSPSVAGENGFREFKLEFIDSPAMSGAAVGGIVVSFMEISLQVELLDDDPVRHELYDTLNLAATLREAGYVDANGYLDDTLVGQQNPYGSYVAKKAFDGVTYAGDSGRWLGYVHNSGGCYGEIRVPAGFRADDLFYLKSCRLWTLSTSGNELRRAPTAWKVLGLADATSSAWTAADDTGWTEVSSYAGQGWSNVKYNAKGQNTMGSQPATSSADGYRAFRFRPLSTQATAAGETGIDFGLNEVEFFVLPVNPKGTLRVRSSVKGCDFGGGLTDGSSITESTTMTVPEYAVCGSKTYRVTGYRPETFDYEQGKWTVGETVAARSYEYVKDADVTERIVWEVEEAAVCRINAVITDGGNETVTVSPLKDYYAVGEEVTVTAYPNTDVLENAAGATNWFRSAFVRWEGDTNGLADVTSPAITFTVDQGRLLTPVFRRDWLAYEYDLANEGGEGKEWRMRDGNFELRISKNDLAAGSIAGAEGWLLSGYGSFDLDTKVIRSDTGAAVTVGTVNLPQLGSDAARRADFTRVVLPKTMTKFLNSAFRDQTNLVEAVVDCPGLTQLGVYLFTRDTALRRLVLKVPNLTQLATDYVFYNVPLDETDASDWSLDSLQEFKAAGNESRFSLWDYSGTHGFSGTLTLPRVERIGRHDFSAQKRMTAAVLGSAKGSLKEVGANAFNKCAALQSLTIGCGDDLTVAKTAFVDCPKLKEVTFLKLVPPAEALDAILTNATAAARANVYVTPNRPLPDGFLLPIGEDDPNPPADAVGVYATAAGDRKAWVFHKESPLDPKGILIIVK